MRKIIFLILIFLILCFCSFFKSRAILYPSGLIFPLEKDGGIPYKGKIIGSIQKEGTNLYLSTKKGFVYGIDGKERKIAWSFEAESELASPPYLGEKKIFVYDKNNTLYCLDRDGKLSWKKRIEEKITSGVREDKENIYFGTEKGIFMAGDLTEGKELWSFKAEGAIYSTPVVASGIVIFGSDDGHLYFLDEKGSVLDRFDARDKIRATPLVDGKLLYFGSDNHYFYGLDWKKRKEKWKVKTGCGIVTSPVSDKKRVFFLCMNGILYCLGKKSGTILWWRAVPFRSFYQLTMIKDRIVVSSWSSLLVCFDVQTGERIGNFEAGQIVQSNPIWLEPYLLINLYDFENEEGSLVYLKKEIKMTLAPSKESPQNKGEELVFTASTTGFFKPSYEFYLNHLIKVDINPAFFMLFTEWQKKLVQEKSKKDSWVWFPEEPGAYVIGVQAADEKEKLSQEILFLVKKEEPKVSLFSSKDSPQKTGEKIIFNSSATGVQAPQYEFYLSLLIRVDFSPAFFTLFTEWQKKLVQEKSEKNSWAWSPEEPGAYVVGVKAADEKEKAETTISFVVEKKMTKEMQNWILFVVYWIKFFVWIMIGN